MGCGVCSSDAGGLPAGCKSNGGCSTGGCNKLNSFDWLGNMDLPGVDPFDIVEVRFKAGRKAFYKNVNRLFLSVGDPVVVESQTGHHLGFVAIQGELVRLQMKKKKIKEEEEFPIIYRIATDRDLERLTETRKREMPTMYRTRQIVKELNLEMKLSDVEYQADNTKATFFYSADERVDFRELIKVLAGEFKIRVEMRQISLRQEASRIGGIGSCGRELCCSTWLTEFQSVSTGAARYQNLSLNPNKLSGQCGRLKCCLNYELETYQDALIDIPKVDQPLQIERGEASLQKIDIFKKQLWFSFENDSNWYPISAERVIKIQAMNAQGKKAETLDEPLVVEVEKPTRKTTRSKIANAKKQRGGTQKKVENKGSQRQTKNQNIAKKKDGAAENIVKQEKKTGAKPSTQKSRRRRPANQQGKGAGNANQGNKQNPKNQEGVNKEEANNNNNNKKKSPRQKPKMNAKKPVNNSQKPTDNGTPSDKPKRPSRRRRPNNRKKTPPKKPE